jgi:hypothetical protein
MPTELAPACDRQSEENAMELQPRYSEYNQAAQEGKFVWVEYGEMTTQFFDFGESMAAQTR